MSSNQTERLLKRDTGKLPNDAGPGATMEMLMLSRRLDALESPAPSVPASAPGQPIAPPPPAQPAPGAVQSPAEMAEAAWKQIQASAQERHDRQEGGVWFMISRADAVPALIAALTAQREAGAEQGRQTTKKAIEEWQTDRNRIIRERDALAARVREGEKALDRATKATVEAITREVEAVCERRAAIDFREWPAALAAAVRDGIGKGKPTPPPAPEQPAPHGAGCACCHCEPVVPTQEPAPLEVGRAYPANKATMNMLPVGAKVRYVDGGGHDYGICDLAEGRNTSRWLWLATKDCGTLAGESEGGTLTIVALPAGDNRK